MKTPTDAQLRQAYLDVRLPWWPSLEEALQDRIRGGLIRARAAGLANAQKSTPGAAFDWKRRAAGDAIDFADTEDPE